ncbi:hypothetical protein DITRI_Ditri05aG0147300 [Diplodiscus trichospermus]
MGEDALLVSHLQFADDTIIFCKLKKEQIHDVKRVLRYFQVALGLKINFQKSRFFGIGMDQQSVVEWANLINCKVDNLPTYYLGFLIGAKSNSLVAGKPVIEKFQRRFSRWKSTRLSIGGRVVMIKLVLSFVSIYFMFLF